VNDAGSCQVYGKYTLTYMGTLEFILLLSTRCGILLVVGTVVLLEHEEEATVGGFINIYVMDDGRSNKLFRKLFNF